MGTKKHKYEITAPDYHHIDPERPLELTRMKTWKFRTLKGAEIKQTMLLAELGLGAPKSAYPITRVKN